jgi:phospholipase C
MSSVFRPFGGGADAPLSFPARETVLETVHKAQFKGMPSGWRRCEAQDAPGYRSAAWRARQEPGTRPAVALPYKLSVEGVAEAGGLRLTMSAGRGAGAGFHVYTPGVYKGSASLRTRAYTVAPGGTLVDTWALDGFAGGRYELRVHGPNGFYRELAGTAADRLEVQCVEVGGDVEVRLVNHGERCSVLLTDESYGARKRTIPLADGAKTAVRLPLQASAHWYDFSITVDGFRRRYAGHVETGRVSTSDPAMGA